VYTGQVRLVIEANTESHLVYYHNSSVCMFIQADFCLVLGLYCLFIQTNLHVVNYHYCGVCLSVQANAGLLFGMF
jgi:hypothetical protein